MQILVVGLEGCAEGLDLAVLPGHVSGSGCGGRTDLAEVAELMGGSLGLQFLTQRNVFLDGKLAAGPSCGRVESDITVGGGRWAATLRGGRRTPRSRPGLPTRYR
jgi:hypothetical protein